MTRPYHRPPPKLVAEIVTERLSTTVDAMVGKLPPSRSAASAARACYLWIMESRGWTRNEAARRIGITIPPSGLHASVQKVNDDAQLEATAKACRHAVDANLPQGEREVLRAS